MKSLKKIQWNTYTWYSKLLSIIFFLGVFPVLTFYIGVRYEETKNILNDQQMQVVVGSSHISSPTASSSANLPVRYEDTGDNFSFLYNADTYGVLLKKVSPLIHDYYVYKKPLRAEGSMNVEVYIRVHKGASVKGVSEYIKGSFGDDIESTERVTIGGQVWTKVVSKTESEVGETKTTSYVTGYDTTMYVVASDRLDKTIFESILKSFDFPERI